MNRRAVLGAAYRAALLLGANAPLRALAVAPAALFIDYPQVVPGTVLSFPRDHGAHPDYRTEWWYVTGLLNAATAMHSDPLGFQVTFFRSRLDSDPANPSAFAARQLLFGHAAVSDPKLGRLVSAQCAARSGFGLAEATEADLRVVIGDWSLQRSPLSNQFAIRVPAGELHLALEMDSTQAVLAEGEVGFSRKGPELRDASEYYSLPHLAVSGTVEIKGKKRDVRGDAWMDREWSSSYLAASASGWDWTGLNLDDGGALMAFRIREKSGGVLWAGASLRRPNGSLEVFPPESVTFTTQASWRSPRTGVTYPVAQDIRVGRYGWQLVPLMKDQELDSSASTGTIYWEGAVHAASLQGTDSVAGAGHGYLELTGYDQPLKL